VIYLDTSAPVKLIRIEAESDDLGDWLDERTEVRWITSALAEVELPRVTVHPETRSAAGNCGAVGVVSSLLGAPVD
jgi:predicted nucleic acid-binding protein